MAERRPRPAALVAAGLLAAGLAGCGGSGGPGGGGAGGGGGLAPCVPHCAEAVVTLSPAATGGGVTELVLRGTHGVAAGARVRGAGSPVRLAAAPGDYTLTARVGEAARCRARIRLTAAAPTQVTVVRRARRCGISAGGS
jgi:hypothetical protein